MPTRFRKPMMAKEFADYRDKIIFPCYVQPKLDGIRCVTDGQMFWSRNGKEFSTWNTHHLRQPKRLPFLVDGEFMIRDGGDFEDLSSIARRHKHPACEELELNVFDMMAAQPFEWRIAQVKRVLAGLEDATSWRFVPTTIVKNVHDIDLMYRRYLQWGREGAMVRSAAGLYVSSRTMDLLKYKPLKSKEFEIVDILEAKGKDKRTPVFVCWTGKGKIDDVKNWFRVRPMGTTSQRKSMWYDKENIFGQMLTVEFQNLTKYGKPRFPRAKVLRNYE